MRAEVTPLLFDQQKKARRQQENDGSAYCGDRQISTWNLWWQLTKNIKTNISFSKLREATHNLEFSRQRWSYWIITSNSSHSPKIIPKSGHREEKLRIFIIMILLIHKLWKFIRMYLFVFKNSLAWDASRELLFIKLLYLHSAIGGVSNETNIFQMVSRDKCAD